MTQERIGMPLRKNPIKAKTPIFYLRLSEIKKSLGIWKWLYGPWKPHWVVSIVLSPYSNAYPNNADNTKIEIDHTMVVDSGGRWDSREGVLIRGEKLFVPSWYRLL